MEDENINLGGTRRSGRWAAGLLGALVIFICGFLLGNAKSIESNTKSPETIPSPTVSPVNEVKIKKIIDGDTIEMEDGRKLRYIGIDTPETVDPRRPDGCFGKEASEVNKQLVEGKEVRLEKDVSETDVFGRILRYVWVGDVFVNDYLVRQGFAKAVSFPPDIKFQEQFRQAEAEARENKRGLWADGVCPLGN